MQVGKQDYSRPTEHTQYPIHTLRANQLPQAHTRIPPLYKFFLEDINEQIPEARWQLTQEDATSLLGSHGMMQNQNCMTDGVQPGTAPAMTDRTCSGAGGTQRMFKWSNHYWQVGCFPSHPGTPQCFFEFLCVLCCCSAALYVVMVVA